ncbi:hypothetical protein [Arthrobacter sp. Alg241-R88]|uniref:hypothetical protein n=1 Tax=Arthrobacter sp. Alg241-R88 TaxID=2305984 RepID=UPI0013D86953|nr:hypothetical protein [Arthrobacter sp. Alg241-R88]
MPASAGPLGRGAGGDYYRYGAAGLGGVLGKQVECGGASVLIVHKKDCRENPALQGCAPQA